LKINSINVYKGHAIFIESLTTFRFGKGFNSHIINMFHTFPGPNSQPGHPHFNHLRCHFRGGHKTPPVIVDCLSMMCKLNFPVQGRLCKLGGVAVRPERTKDGTDSRQPTAALMMDTMRTCHRPQSKIFLHFKIMGTGSGQTNK